MAIKQCKKCGSNFVTTKNRAWVCPSCQTANQQNKSKNWESKKSLKRMAVYTDDYNKIKSIHPSLSVYDALHTILEEKVGIKNV